MSSARSPAKVAGTATSASGRCAWPSSRARSSYTTLTEITGTRQGRPLHRADVKRIWSAAAGVVARPRVRRFRILELLFNHSSVLNLFQHPGPGRALGPWTLNQGDESCGRRTCGLLRSRRDRISSGRQRSPSSAMEARATPCAEPARQRRRRGVARPGSATAKAEAAGFRVMTNKEAALGRCHHGRCPTSIRRKSTPTTHPT